MGVQSDDGWVWDGTGDCHWGMPIGVLPHAGGRLECRVAGFGTSRGNAVAAVFIDC